METLGRYTLLRRVAAGGMAEIWKAKVSGAAGFEKQLAIKRVLPHLAEDREFVEMFVQEAKLVAGLVHPNIVQVFDFGQIGEDYFLAMEFVPGCNLDKLERRLAEREVKLAAPVALFVGAEVCKGLGAAHALTDAKGVSRNLVHRDVSPQNVLVSFAGAVKVGDFGIAKAVHLRSRTETGLVRGKSAYMSPEQSRGEALDARSDLFSAGIVLYEMIAGRRLFEGRTTLEVMQRVSTWKGPDAETLSFVPDNLHELFATALHPDPAQRYADAVAMETAISWHLGADGAVRARQALGALVREIFADEAAREAADTGEALVDPNATVDAPKLATEALDSRKVTVRPPLIGIADRAHRGPSPVAIGVAIVLAAGAVLTGLRAADLFGHGDATVDGGTVAAVTGTAGVLDASASSAAVLPSNATTADFTLAAVATDGLALPSPSPEASIDPADISPQGVDRRRREIHTLLARRFLSTADLPEVADALENARLARADGRLIDALHELSRAHEAIDRAAVSYQFVATKFDRVKTREFRVASLPGAPADELAAGLEDAHRSLLTAKYLKANRQLYDLDRRMDEFDR